MRSKRGFIILTISVLMLLTLAAIIGVTYFYSNLNSEMQERMQKRQVLVPTIYYGGGNDWRKNQQVDLSKIQTALNTLRKRLVSESLLPGDYGFYKGEQCRNYVTPESTIDDEDNCLVVFWPKYRHPGFENEQIKSLLLDKNNWIIGVFIKPVIGDFQETELFRIPPKIIAQYLGEEPLLYSPEPLNVYPASCLNAIVAIEDAHFLEHKGVSFTGILRAFIKNVVLGRKAQGGSTITQQMVKNFFLTPEKTFVRKIKEIFMALILENQFDKDLILENYLNIIYMGQKGSYQVRGYGAASEYYFDKHIQDLSLPECALLAAIVNSPGMFSPFTHADRALERRKQVLTKMEEQKFISAQERDQANAKPLPVNKNSEIYTTLPYFIQAVQRQLTQDAFSNFEGLKIYTTLDVEAQAVAQDAIEKHLESLDANLLKKTKKKLESILVAADVDTGFVRALVGGRSYKVTQFNRVLNSQRQVGSTFKPFVYLTALMNKDAEGNYYTPMSELKDEPFVYTFGKQKWEPQNYSKKSQGPVPLFYALKESLNLPTAKLAMDLGLDNIIDVAKDFGLANQFEKVPSLCLGSFGLSPLQLLQGYLNIARLGKFTNLTFVERVLNFQGDPVWEFKTQQRDFRDQVAVQELVGIMKETIQTGTAHIVKDRGFVRPAAGKTGTTNDSKDTWFAGFTPLKVAVVWTGFDDTSSTGLTGASGAVPIWFQYMNQVTKGDPAIDFAWSDKVRSETIDLDAVQSKDMLLSVDAKAFKETNLIFREDED
jgi:penicillin-binding protein 1B